MIRSIAGRLALMFAAAAALVFVVGAALLHASLGDRIERQLRDELQLRASLLETSMLKAETPEHWAAWIAPKLEALQAASEGSALWVEGEHVGFRFGQAPDDLARRVTQPSGHALVTAGDREMATLVRHIAPDGERPALRFVMTRDTAPYAATLADFRAALIVTVVVGVALVALMGYGIARLGLAPLARLSAQARLLHPGDTAKRLGFVPMPRELSHLTASFNGALDRLARACRQLEAFNANVAHELRTPLGNLIGQTQVAMMRRRSADDLAEVLGSNLEELERMRGIVNDMLFLARADQGARVHHAAAVSLADEVRKVADYLAPLLDDAKVKVDVQGDARLPVDPALFRRAVSNLLHNAIQHGRAGGMVVVRVGAEQGLPAVSVSNPGEAIEPAHLAHLFDRFYRTDEARANAGGNHGLGLSIVQAIAAMHRGSVFARSQGGWNTFGFTVTASG
jgi:two-component system heavy metal sensor histidine kinase CusS